MSSIIGRKRSVIPACDVDSLDRLGELLNVGLLLRGRRIQSFLISSNISIPLMNWYK
jgi:hypothetical protein